MAELSVMALLPVVSWVVSIYRPAVRSLLDAGGLRWMMSSWVHNFTRLPVGETILLLMALSVFQSSGLAMVVRGHLSLKQKRALMFTLAALLTMTLAVAAMTLLPPYALLNFFGGLSHSPLIDSIPSVLLLMVEVMSSVYGFTSGKIVTAADFSHSHTQLLNRSAPLFIHVFLLSQIIAWLKYSYFL